MLRRPEVYFLIVAFDNRGHVRRHEKLPQLTRLRSVLQKNTVNLAFETNQILQSTPSVHDGDFAPTLK
jgi:hypothetical protein